MNLTIALYNVEWMKRVFKIDGTPKTSTAGSTADRKEGKRSEMLAAVIAAIDPDILCIVEGPDTKADLSKTASQQLKVWASQFGLNGYDAVNGFASPGQQELCALYKKAKVKLSHKPEKAISKHPFNQSFLVDTTDSLIKEQYKHYRPPFEIQVRKPGQGGAEVARIILAHTKSKGIFDNVDLARFEQLSLRNRQKLYAECFSIRERCDQWLKANPSLKLLVMGDINDGFGLDYYEQRFRRSAVEILLGDVWKPEKILRHVLPKPKVGKYGWTPSSSSFTDKVTEDRVNVLIDHILVSQSVKLTEARVWNPYLRDAPQEVMDLKEELKKASDHFPVVAKVTGV